MAQVVLKNSFNKIIPVGTTGAFVAPLPVPLILVSGTADAGTGSGIVFDSTKNFITSGVRPGFTVMNMSSGTTAFVNTVNSATQITLSQAIGLNVGSIYTIYAGGKITGTPWDGALLWNRATSTQTVTVRSLDGDNLSISIPAGAVCPLQVTDVASNPNLFYNIYALW